jgi:RNA polymerase sigma-70 factor (ECF subfamily)
LSSIVRFFRVYKNEKEQFTNLLGPHIEIMYRMAYHWTRSQEDAEDLVQDVLIKLVSRVEEMLAIEQLRPWLIKVLYYRFVDLYRREQAAPIVVELKVAGSDVAVEDPIQRMPANGNEEDRLDLQQRLLKALETLDDDQRDVVLLHMVEGYTALEIAEILDANVGTVKSRLQRAKTKLKKFLQAGPF